MPLITRGATVIDPTLVLGYECSRDVPTITHVLLAGGTRHSLRAALPRTGTLALFFATYAAAWAAGGHLATTGPWVLTDTDVPAAGMTFIVAGIVLIKLDPVTLRRWTIDVPFVEVL